MLLIDLSVYGVENVLALRGDAPKSEEDSIPEEKGTTNAQWASEQIKQMRLKV